MGERCDGCPVTSAQEKVQATLVDKRGRLGGVIEKLGGFSDGELQQDTYETVMLAAQGLGLGVAEASQAILHGLRDQYYGIGDELDDMEEYTRHVQEVCGSQGVIEASIVGGGLARAVGVCPHSLKCEKPECVDEDKANGLKVNASSE